MTTKSDTDKALDLFTLLMQARNETLPAISEAKAKLDAANAIIERMADFEGCGDGKGNNDADHVSEWAMETLSDERMAAERVLNDAIAEMVERDAAVWEAHAEFRRLYDAEPNPPGRPKLTSVKLT